MEPVPESVEASHELDTDEDLLGNLLRLSGQVSAVVPDCVGMSFTTSEPGVTFTVVATAAEIAALDAVQYVAGGPCVDTVADGRVRAVEHSLMDEEGWWLFAAATAARGVASTFSLPLVDSGRVVGGFNLYAASPGAFDGHHEVLAEMLGAWAAGAVTNADLSFETRRIARRAPAHLREVQRTDVAVGLLAGRLNCSLEVSLERLRDAASRAAVEPATLTDLVLELLRPGVE